MQQPDRYNPIDIVLPWVDGNDPAWLAEKQQVLGTESDGDDRILRYRDWDILRYILRGIEQFLPWVRVVHLVTWGHLPDWLNRNAGKLHIVRHTDYIPAAYLPTYSSHTIELNFHRIESLADQFILANDDTLFLKPMEPEDFFRKGLPVDAAIQNVLQFWNRSGIDHIVANNLLCVNENFDKKECIRQNRSKWFHPVYGKGNAQNMYLQQFSHFTGFEDFHLPNAYRKETWQQVWDKEPDILDATCRRKVRSPLDVNQWVMRYWRLAQGAFEPVAPNRGRMFTIGRDDEVIQKAIQNRSFPMLCLADDSQDIDFEKEKKQLSTLLEELLPGKSGYEQ